MHMYTVPVPCSIAIYTSLCTDSYQLYIYWQYGFIAPFVLHVIVDLFEVHDNDILKEILLTTHTKFVVVSTEERWIKPI